MTRFREGALKSDGPVVLTELLPRLRLQEALSSLVSVHASGLGDFSGRIAELQNLAETVSPQVFAETTVLLARAWVSTYCAVQSPSSTLKD